MYFAQNFQRIGLLVWLPISELLSSAELGKKFWDIIWLNPCTGLGYWSGFRFPNCRLSNWGKSSIIR
ncbi:unnamed protein product [Amaranthus hypochondriacus]